jgi:hypothetical protein
MDWHDNRQGRNKRWFWTNTLGIKVINYAVKKYTLTESQDILIYHFEIKQYNIITLVQMTSMRSEMPMQSSS